MKNNIILLTCLLITSSNGMGSVSNLNAATIDDYSSVPPFVTSGAPPLLMLVMGRNHKLYYEAYNDASDLDEDGVLDYGYKGEAEPFTDSNSDGAYNSGESFTDENSDSIWTEGIEYYGYFDSYKCYTYNSSATSPLFEPTSTASDKKCSGANEWSGDFLNYLTMSRMDTMRKVLYGGWRSEDTTTKTVLQRVFIPQDGHTWGKEYTNIATDHYDIDDYTPFSIPTSGRHLFASTTLQSTGDDGIPPVLRVTLNNPKRIWDWVAKEGPVADDSIVTSSTGHPGHPGSVTDLPDDSSAHAEYEAIVNTYANGTYLTPGIIPAGLTNINGGGDYANNYMAIFTGILNVNTAGTYSIAVDGDDAVEVIIDGGTANEEFIGYYGAHGRCNCTNHHRDIFLSAGAHTFEFRMEEAGGGDNWYLYWNGPDSGGNWNIIPASSTAGISNLNYNTYSFLASSGITNYEVRVEVCDPSVGLETNCRQYPNGNYKPIGLLQRKGENEQMYFGLLTGSYAKNTSGGVLRKPVSTINDEIVSNTGQFNTATNGIIQTINKMHIYDWNKSSYDNCGWITNGPMSGGRCLDWGNPVAEMMYETQRYFAGKGAATSAYDYSGTTADSTLGLPKISAWGNPYDKDGLDNIVNTSDDGFPECAQPFMLVLSDINPTFDSDELPGVDSNFDVSFGAGDLAGLDVSALAATISTGEGISGNKYIGQNASVFDGACTEKTISGFGDVRGLCPEEPTKGGSYYSAAVAYYGHENDLQSAVGKDQKVTTYTVGLASPLPRIEFKIGTSEITLVPFAKTVGNNGNSNVWNYWPTNTIVDFFVESLTPTSGTFRINYEDVEQGADHDMDDIVVYTYQLVDGSGAAVVNPANAVAVDIALETTYASGSYIQHAGYIISGTTKDGSYLDITDLDTAVSNDFLVFLDTPPGSDPISSYNDVSPNRDREGTSHNTTLGTLPYSTVATPRRFYPNTSGTVAAQLLKNPLWYAAKWGAFDDSDGDGTPIEVDGSGNPDNSEWDKDGDGVPDTYYYVTNPLRLEEQLDKAFTSILNQASSGTAASVISNTRSGEGALYQSVFFPKKALGSISVSWVGQLHSLLVDAYGQMREDTNDNQRLDVIDDYIIIYNADSTAYRFRDADGNQLLDGLTVENCFTDDTDANNIKEYVNDCNTCTADDTIDCLVDSVYDSTNKTSSSTDKINLDDLGYLWNSSKTLNGDTITDTVVEYQRSPYYSSEAKRYIFTWVDDDGDGFVDDVSGSSEVIDFTCLTTLTDSDLVDVGEIYPYLHLYPSFDDISEVPAIEALYDVAGQADFKQFLRDQTCRQINYIRGSDCANSNSPLTCNTQDLRTSGGVNISGTAMRSRQFDYNGDSSAETWRLGDIVYSTPTLVGRPAEGYHLLYRDSSYAEFAAKYNQRRNVVYAGANDGMVHAFNAGFFDSSNIEFKKSIDEPYTDQNGDGAWASPEPYEDWDGSTTHNTTEPFELGAEMWAYVPFNLLPHLYWLTDPAYDEEKHVYYVDQKPRIFDAKIFPADVDHPNGWGTVMAIGMRFGGAAIVADMDKTDGKIPDVDNTDTDGIIDPTMRSAMIIFDITNPETVPTLLAEVILPDVGFTTSYPTVVVMKDAHTKDRTFDDYNSGENKWFLAFGSGPADSNGDPGTVVAATGDYDSTILSSAKSMQNANFYMLDLVQLVSGKQFYSLTDNNTSNDFTDDALASGLFSYATLDANSFVTDPVTADFDLDYNADVVYFGTIGGDPTGWGGKMRRIVIDNENDPDDWNPQSVLLNIGQPISAAASVGKDDDGRYWVYFGSGRYFTIGDKADTSLQSYYGVKEPVDSSEELTWAEITAPAVARANGPNVELVNVTNYQVFSNKDVLMVSGVASSPTVQLNSWQDLIDEQSNYLGWYIDFESDRSASTVVLKGERNLGQAALIGGLLSFTTFTPDSDVCEVGGTSDLWALYYKTGTAHYSGVLDLHDGFDSRSGRNDRAKRSLADQANNEGHTIDGLATSPSIHTGREDGSAVFVQSSTGEIIKIEEENPLRTKSGMQGWKLR